jgi:hypothetical protein
MKPKLSEMTKEDLDQCLRLIRLAKEYIENIRRNPLNSVSLEEKMYGCLDGVEHILEHYNTIPDVVVDDTLPKNQIKLVNKQTGQEVVFNVGDGQPREEALSDPLTECFSQRIDSFTPARYMADYVEKGVEFICHEDDPMANPIAGIIAAMNPSPITCNEDLDPPLQEQIEREQLIFNQRREDKKKKEAERFKNRICQHCQYWTANEHHEKPRALMSVCKHSSKSDHIVYKSHDDTCYFFEGKDGHCEYCGTLETPQKFVHGSDVQLSCRLCDEEDTKHG